MHLSKLVRPLIKSRHFLIFVAISIILYKEGRADHGPSTSGSGVTTQTAETLKKKQWSTAVHLDWTEFESIDEKSLEGLHHFDFLDRSYLTTFGVSYGVTDNLQIGLSVGYYVTEGGKQIPHSHSEEGAAEPKKATGAVSPNSAQKLVSKSARAIRRTPRHIPRHSGHGNHNGGGQKPPPAAPVPDEPVEQSTDESEFQELAAFDADGWTDIWLTGKYRVYHGPVGQFAVLGGIKFPTGETEIYNSVGLRVERGSAASSGAWDGMIGSAYTIAIAPNISMDVSAQFTFRGQKGGYRLGNRLDAGIAAGWRVYGGAQQYPQLSLLGEVALRHLERGKEYGFKQPDTGGTTLFASPGFRVVFNPHLAWCAAVHLPLLQELNGNQAKTEFHVTTSFDLTF